MKKVIAVFSFSLALIFSQSIIAQEGHPHHRFHHKQQTTLIDMVKADLDLTEEQEQQLEELRKKLQEDRKTLREELHSNEEMDRAVMHKKMKAQREAQFEQVMNILNEEQQAILKAKKEEVDKEMKQRRAKMGKRSENLKELRTEMKAYRENNIMPALSVQRSKLENTLSAEDKATIAELRPIFEEMKQRRENRFEGKMERKERPSPEMREKRKAEHQAKMEKLKPHHETLKALVDKYEADIDKLFAELDDEHEVWKKDMDAIHHKHMGEKAENLERRHPRMRHNGTHPLHKGQRGKGHKKGKDKAFHMRKAHFLLMQPTETPQVPASQNASTKINVFPNPASDLNTINYEVKQAGQVRIELRSEGGDVIRVLTDEYKESGKFAIEVDLSDLRDGVYYYTITDGNGIISKKVVVSK